VTKRTFRQRGLYAAMIIAMLMSVSVLAPVAAQPTQALTEDWRATDFNFLSNMMDTDSNDNVYILGDSVATRILIIKKFSAAGTLLWQTTYDPIDALSGVWIAVDGNGDAVVQANMVRASTGQPAGWLTLKYDTNGNLLWVNSLPGIISGSVRVEVDADNNIYVAGYRLYDAVLIKYSPAGTTLWTAVFDNNGAIDVPSSMAISPDNSRIGVAGASGNLFLALMYDADGNRLWANTTAMSTRPVTWPSVPVTSATSPPAPTSRKTRTRIRWQL